VTTVELAVLPGFDGFRADVFLAESLKEITRSAAQKLLNDGHVTLADTQLYSESTLYHACQKKIIGKNHRVKSGEIIFCKIPAPVPSQALAQEIPLNIVYEDADLLVVDKPRGMVVHPAAGHYSGTLVNALLFHCRGGLSGIGGVSRPGIVHRLDKDTSGLMVVAKNDATHVALAGQLQRREMGRTYNAVCVGAVREQRFRIDLPIGRHPRDRKKMAVLTNTAAKTRVAVTNIEVLERFGNFSLVAARLETGRTHQIRVHMAHLGHPVLGDAVYGGLRQKAGFTQGQILHAINLSFTHPSSGEEAEFNSPLPEYFEEAIKIIRGAV